MNNEVYANDPRVMAGIGKLAKAVSSTLGPGGKNVLLGRDRPMLTKDGVTVAREIRLKDEVERIGADLIKEVASKTNDVAGDGTTTATILAHAILVEGMKMVAAGHNPVDLKKGINLAVADVVKNLKSISREVKDEDIFHVASISANDRELGRQIADMIKAVGKDGIISVEESPTGKDEQEIVKGMRLDSGMISPYMATDLGRMQSVMDDAYVLITDSKISTVSDFLPILEKFVKETDRKELVIVADDISGDALASLVMNKLKLIFTTVAVKAPKFGKLKKDVLQDLAMLTGGKVISQDTGLKLETMKVSDLGRARKVTVTKDHATFIDGFGDKKLIQDRIDMVKAECEKSTDPFDRAMLLERTAKLSGGIGVMKVGASTSTELDEKRQRIEDSINATKAALAEGIVPGGGEALIRAWQMVGGMDVNFQEGYWIVRDAIEQPLRIIALNAGKDPSVVLMKVKEGTVGYDAEEDEYVDMLKAGIMDPTKVTRTALENAASIAVMLLTSDITIANVCEE